MKVFIALSLVCALSMTEAYVSLGDCPQITHVADFDLNQYLGRWYEMDTFSMRYIAGDECVTSDFGYVSENEMSIKNSWVDQRGLSSVMASGVLTGEETGQFIFTFGKRDPDFYNVLAVDYEKYSVAYACRQVENMKDEQGWIHFRSNERDPELIAEALKVFEDNGIDVEGKFSLVFQGIGCIYNPEP